MKLLIYIIGGLILVSGCVQQTEIEGDLEVQKEGMAGWQVPDGFNYEMSSSVSIHVSFTNKGARIMAGETLQYAVVGEDADSQMHGLFAGYADLSEGISMSLTKPMHIENLYLYTKYHGDSKYFDITDGTVSISISDLEVTDEFFGTGTGRVASTPDCTSFLGNATQIRCREDGVSIKSSASISYIDVTYLSGAVDRTTPEEQSVNANDNQWFFSYADFDITSIKSFTVTADCRTSPQTISTELVTFINPCIEETVDSDNDGVLDLSDLFPDDPTLAGATYIPAKSTFSTYAFEDMWPYLGDFDFNDLIIAHNAEVYTNANDMVTKMSYTIMVEAVGANFDNDLCLNFSDPGASISLTIDSIESKGVAYELHKLDGKSEIRFKHIKSAFSGGGYINTDSTRAYQDPVIMGLVILFDGSVHIDDFEIDEYLRVNQEEGREVHKPGRPYTSLFDETLIGQAADDTDPTQDKYFLTENNLPWALEIPTMWEYPVEKVEISEAYPNFEDYVQGRSTSPWYTDAEGNKVHKNIYKKKRKM